jgi:anti-sigma regulatory factor (Ser/Thr protein kinase)
MRHQWALKERDYEGVSAARRDFSRYLEACSDERAAHDYGAAAIIFGELVGNAVKYGREPISVWVEPGPSHALLHVRDCGSCFELKKLRTSESGAIGGRGVSIVAALARSLTVRVLDSECCVTAELPVRLTSEAV